MTPPPGAMSAQQEAHLAVSSVARQQSWRARLMLAVAIAALSAVWINWWALVWLGAIVVTEYVVAPWVRDRFVRGGAHQTRWPLMVWRVIVATLYAFGWVPALAVGGIAASIFAICMLSGALIHSLVYFSTTLSQFILSIAPPIILAVSVSILTHGNEVWPWLMLPALAIMVGRALLARTAQARMSRQIIEDQALLEAAETSSRAKTVFLTTMTHELRTPLNAIINFSEMMAEELGDGPRPELAKDAGRIHASGLQLLSIVNAALDYALLDAGNLTLRSTPFDLAQIVAASADKHAGSIALRFDAITIPMIGDPERVAQCCDNLIANAAKFAPGEILQLTVTIEDFGGGTVVHVDFRDRGPGVAPGAAEQIFEPMSQVDATHTRRSGGAGLGLALTRKLARAMGGDCVLRESEPGLGATFRLTLPQACTSQHNRPETV